MNVPPTSDRRRLSELRPGQNATIAAIEGGPTAIAARLHDLGVLPGAAIQLVRCAPLGDPLLVEVCGARLSLRRSEAAFVSVIL